MLRKLLPILCLASAAAAEPNQYTAAELKEDFEALYAGLEAAHYDLYAHRPGDEYDALFACMLAGLDAPMSRQEASVRFQQFAAYGDVAHSRIDYDRSTFEAYRDRGGKQLPVYIRIVDGRAYVHSNYSGNDNLPAGSEILALNGRPMPEWLERTARHLSADTPYIAHSLLEFMFPMYLWQEIGPVERFEFEILDSNGENRTVTVAALSRDEIRKYSETDDAFFSLDSVSREARMLDGDVAYLRPGPFYNVENPESMWEPARFVEFIDESFEMFIDRGAEVLLIDLRDNPGGDASFSDPMIAWFADRPFKFASTFSIRSSAAARASNQARLDANPGATGPSVFFEEHYSTVPYGETFEFPLPDAQPREGRQFEGEVYVLIDRHSYSNTVTVAAIIQDYGFGTILGEKTSDMATTYGAMETFSLPNTGIVVGFPKAHIVRPSGDRKTDGVTPDVAIRSPIAPTRHDVVLERALEVVGLARP